MPGEKCPLPDCHTPITRESARRTEVISHLRKVHNVELEHGYGGNEAGKRRRHGEQFRAWLQQHGYDVDLAKFFTAVRDGLAARSGTATVPSTAPASNQNGHVTSPATPQQQRAPTSTTRLLQPPKDPRSIRAPNHSGRPIWRVNYDLVTPSGRPRVLTFNNLACVFCSDNLWAKDKEAVSDVEYHPEAFSTLDELLVHYERLHSHFSLWAQHEVRHDASGKRNVVRITLTQADKGKQRYRQEPQAGGDEEEIEWEHGLASPSGRNHDDFVLDHGARLSVHRKQAVVQQQTPPPESARNGSGRSSQCEGKHTTTSFSHHTGAQPEDSLRNHQQPAISQQAGFVTNHRARFPDRHLAIDGELLSCELCAREAPLKEAVEAQRTGFPTEEELWAHYAAQHGQFAAFRY